MISVNYFYQIIFIKFRIPTKVNEFMSKIDEKEKKIRKIFGMSYIQYVNVNRQIHQKSLEAMKSRKAEIWTNNLHPDTHPPNRSCVCARRRTRAPARKGGPTGLKRCVRGAHGCRAWVGRGGGPTHICNTWRYGLVAPWTRH